MNTKNILASFFCTLVLVPSLPAAPDTVDPAFKNTAGTLYGDSDGDFGSVASILVQPDGKILVGSNEMATTLGTPPDFIQAPLIRFNPDGTVDNTFFADINMEGSGLGIYYDDIGWPEVMGLGVQSDGKIIAGGVMQGMRDGTNTKVARNIVRINPDGTVDTTFQTFGTQQWISGGINYINHLFVEPNDKIVIAGGFRGVRDFDGGPLIIRHGIARLNADGTADESFELKPTEFGVPAASLGSVRMIVYQAERDNAGNYYIVGEISGVTPAIQVFARVFPDGTRDFSFAPDLGEARWNSVALDRQGRITVTGLIDFNPTVFHRVFPDGSTDPSFNAHNNLFGTMAQPLQIDSAGRLLYESGSILRRLDVDGAIDPTFNATASWAVWATTPSWNLATTAPDGSIYAGGFFNRVNGENSVKIVRFEGDPTANSFVLDAPSLSILENAGTLYLGVTRLGDGVGAASLDFSTTNGTAIAGTDFTATSGTITWAAGENGTKYIPITLIDNVIIDGDKTFTVDLTNPTGATLPGAATATITLLDDEALPTIVNHPQSGTVNEGYPFTFTPSVSVRGAATFQWQRDTGDGFENIAGATSVILRLPNAASADAGDYRLVVTTDTGTVTSDPATLTVETPPGSVLPLSISNLSSIIGNVLALATDADGRTLVMGNVGIRRLLADGTIDPAFTVTFTNTNAGSIVVLPDGKLLISGLFFEVNGQSRTGLARLTADGALDTDFNAGITFGVNAMAVDADGRIYIGGQNNNGLFRYSAAGVFDATFSAPGIGTGAGFNPGSIFSINPQPDGTLLVGHRTAAAPFFVRLLGTGALDPSFTTFAVTPTTGAVLQSLVLTDGRIVIVGNLTDRIIILGENGGIDTSFTLSHVPNSIVNGVAHIDGRLVVWGAFTQVGGLSYRGFARFFLDGSLDQSLPLGGGTNNSVNALITDADGNYLIGGVFTTVGPASRNRLANIFAGPPSALFANAQPVAIENDGSATLTVRRLGDPDGAITLDWATADGTAIAGTDYVAASGTVSWADGDGDDKTILIDLIDNELIQPARTLTVALSNPTGPILAGPPATISIIDDDTPVEFTTQPQDVALYTGVSFELTAATTSPTAVTYQWFLNGDPVDDAVAASYAVATATSANAGTYFLRATNAAGFVDSASVQVIILPEPAAVAAGFSFGPTLNAAPETILPLPDGGALIGGTFSLVNGSSARRYLIRVDADGLLDETFTAVPNGNVLTSLRLPDGRILIGGDFTQISGNNSPRLAIIDENGTLDTTFAANLGSGPNSTVRALALTPQGRFIVAGLFTSFNSGAGTAYVTILNTDGTRDPAFTSLATSTVTAAAVQSDGKILLGGTFTYEGASRFVRVLPTGARDPSFTAALASTPTINRITIREDGTIFLAGQFFISPANRSLLSFTSSGAGPTSEFTGSGGLNLEFLPGTANDRLHLRGSAPGYLWLTSTDTDTANTFNSSLDFNNSVTAMAVENSGAIWAAGAFTQFRGNPAHRVVRLNGIPTNLAITSQPGIVSVEPGETLTLTVGVTSLTTPTFQWYLDGVALADDARISGSNTATLTITGATAADEGAYTLEIINSTADLTTTPIPVYVADAPRVVTMTEDLTELAGKTFILEATVVGAPSMTYAWTRNGSPVNNGGNISGATTTRLVITNSTEANAGTYVLTATNTAGTDTAETVVTILPPPAERSTTFNGLASGGNVNDILPISGGRTLIATASGNLTGGLGGTSSTSRLVLIGPDRTITTPIANFTANTDAITAMAIGPDEKVILRGGFTLIAGSAAPGLVRLNPNFTIDPTFAPAAPPATATALAVDSQGRVLVGGNFTDYAGTGRNYLVRLLPDGSIDTTFTHTLNGEVRRIKVLENDRILVCSGTSNFLPPNHHAGILNADGSLDISFPVNGVNDIDIDAAGNIYLALNNSPRIARYLPDGTADSAFAANVPTLNSSVIRVRVQPNGRIALMGAFTSPANRVLRLNPDGSQDNTFLPGTGLATTTLYSLALDAFGSIWLGGTFTQYQSTTANRIVVLNGDATDLGFVAQPLAFEVDPDGTATFTVEATGSSAISYQWFKNGGELENIGNISGATTATLTIANVGGGDEAEYSVVITNASGTLESRAVPLVLLGAPEFLSVPAGGSFEIANTRVLAPTVRGASTLSYEWQRDGEALSNNAVYSGVSTPVLTITNPREANGGVFTLIVSNSLGDDSADIPVTFFRNPTRIDPDVPALTSLSSISDIILMPDGSRILGGNFTSVGHTNGSGTIRGLAFINLDGSVQNNNVQVYQTTSIGGVNALAMDSQGRLYAGGSFTTSTQGTSGATAVGRLIRATYNTSLARWERDTTFNIGNGAGNNAINRLVIDSAGRILAGGSFTTFNSDTSRQYLVRLLPDGSFDPAFDPAVTAAVTHLVELPDGRILAAGFNFLVRLLPNGAPDPTFVPAVSTSISTLEVFPDGRILIARSATPRLALMEADGTTVSGFPAVESASTSGFNTSAIHRRPDGTILLGGVTNYAGQALTNQLLLINEAGEPLSNYDFEGGVNAAVTFFRTDRQGRIHVGGAFITTYQGITVPRYFVLNGEPIALAILRQPAAITLREPGEDLALTLDAEGTTTLSYQWYKNDALLTDGDGISGSQTATLSITGASAANSGTYLVEVTNDSGTIESLPARVVVGPPVADTAPPARTLLVGDATVLSAPVFGPGPLTYSWARNGVPLSDGPGFDGTDTPFLSISNAQLAASGEYTLTVTNDFGNDTSPPGTLTVINNPAGIANGFAGLTISGNVNAILPMPEGRVLIGGTFSSASDGVNTSGARLAVVNPDGTLHPVAGLAADNTVTRLSIDSAGRPLIAGLFENVHSTPRRRVARLNADFTLDTTFDATTVFNSNAATAEDIFEETGGTLIVTGAFTNAQTVPANTAYAVRLTATGAHDSSFTSGANGTIFRGFPQSDGGLVFVGNFWNYDGLASGGYAVKTLANGSRDPDFTFETLSNFNFTAGTQLANGSLIVHSNGGIIRFNPDGSRDTTYALSSLTNSLVYHQDADGRILTGGNFTIVNSITRNRILRTDDAGLVDPLFASGTGFDFPTRAIATTTDGSIWIGGDFNNYNGTPVQRLVRLTGGPSTLPPAPEPDPEPFELANGFTPNPGFSSVIYALALATDGGVYAGGAFINFGGEQDVDRLVKILPDGSRDMSFTPHPQLSQINQLIRQPDGKLLAQGSLAGHPSALLRFMPNGSLDTAFHANLGTAENGTLNTLDLMPDGRILLGGTFFGWNGTNFPEARHLIRLNADGTFNATESQPDPTGSSFTHVHYLPDGKILLTYIRGDEFQIRGRRLMPDLSRDIPYFIPGSTPPIARVLTAADGNYLYMPSINSPIRKVNPAGNLIASGESRLHTAMAVQNDGSLLAGSGNGLYRYGLGLESDPSFAVPTNSFVRAIAIRPDGRIWIGGSFTELNGQPVPYLALLTGDPADEIESWYAARGIPLGQRGDLDDADGNGVPNLIEYLYQTNPMNPADHPEPNLGTTPVTGTALAALTGDTLDPAATYMIFAFDLPNNTRGLQITPGVSPDLLDFAPPGVQAVEILPPLDNGTREIRRFYINPPVEDLPAGFMRLGISR